ncbi:copper chaperone PCu(A)C [Rosettibacter firmus]|uniref:copper chaperone PCu(A)C n=1 Tax=Rosettibacter firmus TaxID=3111522 RepID=UPI00336BFBE0
MNLLLIFLMFFSSQGNKIKIKEPWMRISAEGQSTALFMKIENTGNIADTLYKVECGFADRVEIHETYHQGEMMGMREVPFIIIPEKSTFELKPRAHHIMVIKLKKDIKKGTQEEFTLYFKQAGKLKVKATAQEMQIQGMGHKH